MNASASLKRGACLWPLPRIPSPHILLALIVMLARYGPARADVLNVSSSGGNVVITWSNPAAILESATNLVGSWSTVAGAISPYSVPMTNAAKFFRLNLSVVPNFDSLYLAPTFTTSIGDPTSCGCTSPENPNSLATGGGAQDNAMGNVLLHTGEFTQDAVDLQIPGRGFDWRFERRYRSGMSYNGPLGEGWDFNHNRRLAVQSNGDILRVDGLGRADLYTRNGDGTFSSPGGFYTKLTTNSGGSFIERDRHGMTNFYSATNSLGIAKLTRVSDRNANQMTFQYNSLGQLTNVVDTLGRTNRYDYDANGHLIRVVDFSGRTNKFAYDGSNNLVSVTSPAVTGTPNGNDFPNGKTTLYGYSSGFADARFNHNLLTVTAPNEAAVSGPARLVAQYDTNPASTNADRLVSLRLGGTNSSGIAAGGTLTYTYLRLGSAGSNDFVTPIFQTTVTNRNTNVTRYAFNQLGNTVRSIQFTRGARAGEPAAYTNTFAFNRDGELIARTNAGLDFVLFTFDSTNSDRLQQANTRERIRHPYPDTLSIVESYTYETNFNFVATFTDGRSNVMSFAYDATGNRTNITHFISSIVEGFAYNAFGQMTAHTLPANDTGYRRRDTNGYYASGPQTGYLQNQIVDAGNLNLTTTYEYDATGNRTRTIDPLGNDTLYSVNALNQVVRESSPQVSTPTGLVRYIRDASYDANNSLVRSDIENRDDTGAIVASNSTFTTTFSYDILDDLRATSQERDSSSNIITAFSYDANQNRTITRFGEATAGRQTNNTIQISYDERDLVFLERRAPGSSVQSTTQNDYDRNGNLIRTSQGTEDVSGTRVTTFGYDGFNRRTSTTNAMGNVSTTQYDANGNTVSQRTDGELNDIPGGASNLRLAESTLTYDTMNRLVQTDRAYFDPGTGTNIAGGHVITKTIYSGTSQVFRTVDADSHTNTVSVDTANRPSLVTDAKTNTIAYAYDADGRVITITEVDKFDLGGGSSQTYITRKFYDQLGRLTNSLNNLSNSTAYAYDSQNNLLKSVDERGNVTRHDYDGLNRKIATTRFLTSNGLGSGVAAGTIVTRQLWDDDSRLLSQTDANSNTTAYVYDALGRTIRTVFADATVSTNSYDVHDNAILSRDANGTSVSVVFNLNNQPTSRVITRGIGVLGTLNENFQYDGLSRLVTANDDDSAVIRNYDSLSRILLETQVLLSSAGPPRTVMYTYDFEGNQLSCTYPGGRVISSTYDSLDNHSTISDTAGVIAQYSWFGRDRVQVREYGNGTRATYNYDGLRQMTLSAHDKIAAGTPIDLRLYGWDAAHNQTNMNDQLAPSLDARSFTYNSANWMTQSVTAVVGPTNRYTLDGVGNRLNVTGGTNAGTYFMNPASPPADFQMNQYTTTPFDARAYDANGNMTNAGAKRFVYDFRNRLVFFTNSASGVAATFSYDALGRRIEKFSGGTTNRFYYSGFQEIEEQNGTNGTVATFVWGNGIDDLLETDRAGQKYYFHADDLGSIRKVTDANTNIVEQYRYDDYGRPSFFNGAGTSIAGTQIGNSTLFTGRRYDAETGLYYYRTRYMDTAAGRFITRDTIGIWGDGHNLGNAYSYVGNNPLSRVDPSGQYIQIVIGATVWILTAETKCAFRCNASPGGLQGQKGFDCMAKCMKEQTVDKLWDTGVEIIFGGWLLAAPGPAETGEEQTVTVSRWSAAQPSTGAEAMTVVTKAGSSTTGAAPCDCQWNPWAVGCPGHICWEIPTHPICQQLGRPTGNFGARSGNISSGMRTAQRADPLGRSDSSFLFGWCLTEKCRCKRDGGFWVSYLKGGIITEGCQYPSWHPPYYIISVDGTVVGTEVR